MQQIIIALQQSGGNSRAEREKKSLEENAFRLNRRKPSGFYLRLMEFKFFIITILLLVVVITRPFGFTCGCCTPKIEKSTIPIRKTFEFIGLKKK